MLTTPRSLSSARPSCWSWPRSASGPFRSNIRKRAIRIGAPACAAGIEDEGAPAFDILFRIVLQSAKRPLDVRCPCCAHLGKDEAWLLQLASLLQRERLEEAAAVLGEWLPPSALRMALLPAKALVQ
jgi:hypothetical protein